MGAVVMRYHLCRADRQDTTVSLPSSFRPLGVYYLAGDVWIEGLVLQEDTLDKDRHVMVRDTYGVVALVNQSGYVGCADRGDGCRYHVFLGE